MAQAIVTRFWPFRWEPVMRHWVPNCSVCCSPYRAVIERMVVDMPLAARRRGWYGAVLRMVPGHGLEARNVKRHFDRRHHPDHLMIQALEKAYAEMALGMPHRLGAFDDAHARVREAHFARHEADLAAYASGLQDDLSHLTMSAAQARSLFGPESTKNRASLQPSALIRPGFAGLGGEPLSLHAMFGAPLSPVGPDAAADSDEAAGDDDIGPLATMLGTYTPGGR